MQASVDAVSERRRRTWARSRSILFLVASCGLLPVVIETTMAMTTRYYWFRYHGWTTDSDLVELSWLFGVALLFEILLVSLVFMTHELGRVILGILALAGAAIAVWHYLRSHEVIVTLWTLVGAVTLLVLITSRLPSWGMRRTKEADRA